MNQQVIIFLILLKMYYSIMYILLRFGMGFFSIFTIVKYSVFRRNYFQDSDFACNKKIVRMEYVISKRQTVEKVFSMSLLLHLIQFSSENVFKFMSTIHMENKWPHKYHKT